jgi:ABC-type thiamine transport system ATPase subunit
MIRIKDEETRINVRASLQLAVMAQVKVFDSIREIENDLGYDLAGLDDEVAALATNFVASEPVVITEEQFKAFLQNVQRDGR